MGHGSSEWLWWGAASLAQITAAMFSIRRGSSRMTAVSMPFRAFGIATLFVSGGAMAAISALHASGLRQLEDWNRIGAGIRRSLGALQDGTPPPPVIRRWKLLQRVNDGNLVPVVVLGGGSFGTAMAAHVASKKADIQVCMLLRDENVCRSINHNHLNCKYFPNNKLPENVIATINANDALAGADFCLHAVPVQFSSSFLKGISSHVDPNLPFISLSKGLELNTLKMMSQIIPQALGNSRQPFVVLSGPSFAIEILKKLPTAMVVASKDKKLANAVQQLLASQYLRISSSRF